MDRTVCIISIFLTADVWNLRQPRKWSMLFITGECLRNIVKKSHFLFVFKNINEAFALNPTPSEV